MGKKVKVMVMEDESGIRNILQLFLANEGFEALEAKNAEEAYRLVEEERPEIAILDIILGGESGFDICKRIKNNENTRNTGIIMFSALNQDHDMEEGKRAGCDIYLPKPQNPLDVIDHVKNLYKEKCINTQ
ncbi:MAG: response regulator transcription factor [Chitinivibrionales bacterium]